MTVSFSQLGTVSLPWPWVLRCQEMEPWIHQPQTSHPKSTMHGRAAAASRAARRAARTHCRGLQHQSWQRGSWVPGASFGLWSLDVKKQPYRSMSQKPATLKPPHAWTSSWRWDLQPHHTGESVHERLSSELAWDPGLGVWELFWKFCHGILAAGWNTWAIFSRHPCSRISRHRCSRIKVPCRQGSPAFWCLWQRPPCPGYASRAERLAIGQLKQEFIPQVEGWGFHGSSSLNPKLQTMNSKP